MIPCVRLVELLPWCPERHGVLLTIRPELAADV
jgi:hypothetical protein